MALRPPASYGSPDDMNFLDGLLILLYLVLGTLGIAWLGNWALKRFKSHK
jgi:hypothetical protein